MSATISPGDLIQARGREWIALPSSELEWLYLRPLSGSESDVQILYPALEREPIRPARFELPDTNEIATQDAARLLSESLRLTLRRGAGPFRSAARLSFSPRAYQLVPLLMALRLPVVRLLIADDVGIGKTIEAGLILREFIDRGEIDRFSILCPPHLVEQWTEELHTKFDIDAVAVTSSSAQRLERGLLDSQTLFETYPFTVVSLDYIKADKRRDNFARACPSFVIVDEAHACVGTHQGRHQRFDLLKHLAAEESRHMIFLTATPHSGNETAFDRLLSLLDKSFAAATLDNENVRKQLAKHFVQRRRIDITGRVPGSEWGEDRVFPKHETTERPYNLDNSHRTFHDNVLDYCLGIVEGAGADQRDRRLAFWGTLALMRCVGSSPAAAVSALRNRLSSSDPLSLEEHVFDDDADEADAVDIEPSTGLNDNAELAALIKQAEKLVVSKDPKLEATVQLLKPILDEGANPVIFCRFIATANHVATELKKVFKKLRIDVVTGELTPDERKVRVEEMGTAEQRLLVATDCLSEGINLQSLFDTVVHYDLSWNPTRHQQREGRVDRFGQSASLVRTILLYSPDSAIDGAVLDVILRKAEAIRKATGVTVPLPEEKGAITNALMNAVLLRKGKSQQLTFLSELGLVQDATAIEARWRDAEEGEKRSRARFAQNTIKPEEVAPEWKRWQEILGTTEQVERFVKRAMSRLDAPLESAKESIYLAHLSALPKSVSERLEARNLSGSVRMTFTDERVPANTEIIKRNHPIPATLAETLLEGALDPSSSYLRPLGRMGAWSTQDVSVMTTVLLLRLRYKLTVHGRRERLLLVEEAETVAFEGIADAIIASGEEARNLLELESSGNLDKGAIDRLVTQARERVGKLLNTTLADHAKNRATQLADDHARVRAAINVPKVSVEVVLPADIIGLFVLVPGGV
jgi:superfamily II DNA or RNA helicase